MAETIHIEVGDDNVRYGISPLDLAYAAEYAENDELLIRGRDGKIYYKRLSDGQIVTYDKTSYDRLQLVQNMSLAHKIDKDFELDDNKVGTSDILRYNDDLDDYGIVYSTINIADNDVDLNENMNIPVGIEFSAPTELNPYGIYLRIRGNDKLNSLMAIANDYPRDSILAVVSCGSERVEYPIGFNQLIHIDKKIILGNSSNDSNTIELEYIKLSGDFYNWVNTHFNSIIGADFEKMNDNNSKFEPTNIDVVSFTSSYTNIEVDYSDLIYNDDVYIIDTIGLKDFTLLADSLSGGSNIRIIDNTSYIENINVADTTILDVDAPQGITVYTVDSDYTGDDGFIAKKYSPTSNIIKIEFFSGGIDVDIPLLKIVKNINTINLSRISVSFKFKLKNLNDEDIMDDPGDDLHDIIFKICNDARIFSKTVDISGYNISKKSDFEDDIITIDVDLANIPKLSDFYLNISSNNTYGAFNMYIYDFKIVEY